MVVQGRITKLTQRKDCGGWRLGALLPAAERRNKRKVSEMAEQSWPYIDMVIFQPQNLTFCAKTAVLMGRERTNRGPAEQRRMYEGRSASVRWEWRKQPKTHSPIN